MNRVGSLKSPIRRIRGLRRPTTGSLGYTKKTVNQIYASIMFETNTDWLPNECTIQVYNMNNELVFTITQSIAGLGAPYPMIFTHTDVIASNRYKIYPTFRYTNSILGDINITGTNSEVQVFESPVGLPTAGSFIINRSYGSGAYTNPFNNPRHWYENIHYNISTTYGVEREWVKSHVTLVVKKFDDARTVLFTKLQTMAEGVNIFTCQVHYAGKQHSATRFYYVSMIVTYTHITGTAYDVVYPDQQYPPFPVIDGHDFSLDTFYNSYYKVQQNVTYVGPDTNNCTGATDSIININFSFNPPIRDRWELYMVEVKLFSGGSLVKDYGYATGIYTGIWNEKELKDFIIPNLLWLNPTNYTIEVAFRYRFIDYYESIYDYLLYVRKDIGLRYRRSPLPYVPSPVQP